MVPLGGVAKKDGCFRRLLALKIGDDYFKVILRDSYTASHAKRVTLNILTL